jgi:hypothetical protein
MSSLFDKIEQFKNRLLLCTYNLSGEFTNTTELEQDNKLISDIAKIEGIYLTNIANTLYVYLDVNFMEKSLYKTLKDNLLKLKKDYQNIEYAFDLIESIIAMLETVVVIKNVNQSKYLSKKLKQAQQNKLLHFIFFKDDLYVVFKVFNCLENCLKHLTLLFDDFDPKKTSDLEYVELAFSLISGFDEGEMPHDVHCTIMLEDLTLKAFAFLMIERIKNMNYINFYTLNSRLYIHSKSERLNDYLLSGDEKLVEKYTPTEFRQTLQNHLRKLFKIAV